MPKASQRVRRGKIIIRNAELGRRTENSFWRDFTRRAFFAMVEFLHLIDWERLAFLVKFGQFVLKRRFYAEGIIFCRKDF